MRRRTRWGRLQAKIIVWFLIPTVIILSVAALFTFYTYQQVTEELAVERNREVNDLLASQLQASLEAYTRPLSYLAASGFTQTDPLTMQANLRLLRDRLQDFDGGVVILDAYGRVLAADWRRLDAVGQDWSEHTFFRQVAASTTAVFSDIAADDPEGTEFIVIAVPLRSEEDEFHGAVAGMFRVVAGAEIRSSSFYTGISRQLRDMEDDTVYLVDRQGRAIYHSDTWRIGEDMTAQGVLQQLAGSTAGGVRTRDAAGYEIVASIAPLPGTGWSLIIEQSWTRLMRPSQRYRPLLILLLALGVVVPTAVIALAARRITRPIIELTGAAQAVAGGRFEQNIVVDTGDELEELTRQFNRMSAQLRESYASLERRVADRTRELTVLNSIAAVVSRSLDLQEILHNALDKTLEAMEMRMGAAYRLEEDGQGLTLMAQRGLSAALVEYLGHLPLWASAAGRATALRQPIALPVAQYPESKLKALLQAEGIQMAISVPLIAKGKVLGALNLGSQLVRTVTPEELSLLAAIGQQAGVAVENARLYEQAEEAAAAAERNRLARELHDAVTQTLFSASMIADVLPRIWERDPKEGQRRLEELRQLTRGALAEMRTLLLELRPTALIEASPNELLRQLTEAVAGRARVPVTLHLAGECAPPPDVKVALYRIAQEALNNVAKHAAASRAEVSLRCAAERIELRISDNGQGFDPARIPAGHLGLGIMHERAEAADIALTVHSTVGHGTTVTAVWQPGHDTAPPPARLVT